MNVWQHDAERVGPGEAEAARAGVRDIAELTDGIGHARARLVAHVFEPVERARDGRDRNLSAAGHIADGSFCHVPP